MGREAPSESQANRELLSALQTHHQSIREHQRLCCIVYGLMSFFASGVIYSLLIYVTNADFEARLELVRCRCSNVKVEASGNHTVTNVHVPNESPIDQRVREILIKKGEINGGLSKPLSIESNPGS